MQNAREWFSIAAIANFVMGTIMAIHATATHDSAKLPYSLVFPVALMVSSVCLTIAYFGTYLIEIRNKLVTDEPTEDTFSPPEPDKARN